MKRPLLRAILAVLAAEIAPVVLLVILVAIIGGSAAETPEALANRLGQWVGPLAGAAATVLGAWWAVRPMSQRITSGAGIGLAIAALDAGIIFAGGIAFEWLFAASWAGRIIAGAAGGALANRETA